MELGEGSKDEVPCVCKNMAGVGSTLIARVCQSVSKPLEESSPGLSISFL